MPVFIIYTYNAANQLTTGLKMETVSLNGSELHHFGYDANGQRVAEKKLDGTVVYFVGEYYEYSLKGTEVHEKKYYGREAMRMDGVLYFILTDHLGSTSVITNNSGNALMEVRYDAWGAIRYSSGTSPTEKLYIGQRFSADLSLYDYKARWYDPLTGRFLMEDPIIPQQGVMRLDRFAYVNNSPILFTDPTGQRCSDEEDCIGPYDKPQGLLPITFEPNEPPDLVAYNPNGVFDGRSGYYGLMRFYDNKNGWWWDDGIFTVNEALALVLYGEAATEVTQDSKGNYSIPNQIKYAAAFQLQSHCQSWDSSACFIGFWSYYQAMYTSTPMDTYNDDLHTFDGGVFISGANSVANHPPINTSSTTLPQGWVTIKPSQEMASRYAKENTFSYKIFHESIYYPPGTYFLVLTIDQQNAFCSAMNLGAMCNLTGVP